MQFTEDCAILRRLDRLKAGYWLPTAVLLFCLGLTGWLWSYEVAEESQRIEAGFALSAVGAIPTRNAAMTFHHGPLLVALFGTCISVLLAGFVWMTLRSRARIMSIAQRCSENERRWKFALEGAGLGVWDWNVHTGEVMYSRSWKEILGFADSEIGDVLEEWKMRLHPDDAERILRDVQACIDGHTDLYVNEHRLRCKDGSYKWMLSRGMATDRDTKGGALRIIGTTSDITGLKQGEENRLEHMARQRDALVREVHHRIKNNLQGVAGLLRQHAAKERHLGDIIDQAIAQVQAVAIVHGLQGKSFDNEVVLCEMVPAIAGMAETLLQPNPIFDIRVDVPARIRVCEKEAVPIALVLNELIVNSAKHARSDAAAKRIGISVVWDSTRSAAKIVITNPGTLPPEFDFAVGKGSGTGLDLVKALLPPEGSRLRFSSADGEVRAELELYAPTIYNLYADPAAASQGNFTSEQQS